MEVADFHSELLEDVDVPSINEMFNWYNECYFGSSLGATVVEWSEQKMTSCAGICYPQRGGGCIIRLSQKLLSLVSVSELKNTLIHECIHAWLITHGIREGNGGHGPRFLAKAAEINSSTVPDYLRPAQGYNITIYHSMINEVRHYQQHHWKCNQCGKLIQRAMNRKPQPADCRSYSRFKGAECGDAKCGYHSHLRACPRGEFIKIKEPQGFSEKQQKQRQKGLPDVRRPKNRPDATKSISDFFKGPSVTSGWLDEQPVSGEPGKESQPSMESRENLREILAGAADKRAAQNSGAGVGAGLTGGPSSGVSEADKRSSQGGKPALQQPDLSRFLPGLGKRAKPEAGGSNEPQKAAGSSGGAQGFPGPSTGQRLAGAGGVGAQPVMRDVSCPVCGKRWGVVSNADLNAHIDACVVVGGAEEEEDVIVLD